MPPVFDELLVRFPTAQRIVRRAKLLLALRRQMITSAQERTQSNESGKSVRAERRMTQGSTFVETMLTRAEVANRRDSKCGHHIHHSTKHAATKDGDPHGHAEVVPEFDRKAVREVVREEMEQALGSFRDELLSEMGKLLSDKERPPAFLSS
eukprot:354032-Prymnesium_polylepis.1